MCVRVSLCLHMWTRCAILFFCCEKQFFLTCDQSIQPQATQKKQNFPDEPQTWQACSEDYS